MSHKNRKIKNVIVNPLFQAKFSIYFLVAGFGLAGTLLLVVFQLSQNMQGKLAKSAEGSFQIYSIIHENLVQTTNITIFVLLVFSVISFIYAIVISHRIAGPVLAIQAYIEELKKGNYDHKRTLRKYDELQPIMDSLTELAENLKHSKKN